jgi:hypothetical protein
MGQQSRKRKEIKDKQQKDARKDKMRALLASTKIPVSVSVIDELEKLAPSRPACREILACLQETVRHFNISLEMQKSSMESIQRLSMLSSEIGSIDVSSASDDAEVVSLLVKMVEYFHLIATPRLQALDPLLN